MSTAIATTPKPSEPIGLTLEVLEKLVTEGDLSKLTVPQRLEYYRARCDAADVDFRTQPFLYLTLKNKLTLYATKGCTDQLIAKRNLNVQIVDRRLYSETQIYEVQARVTKPDGRIVEDIGCVSVKGLAGDDLANAYMKAVTKAKRRTVLSACGLGMLDESEIETIPGAQRATPAPLEVQDIHGKDLDRYSQWCSKFVETANAQWLDKNTDAGGEVAEGVKDLVSVHQLTGHMVKFGTAKGWIPAVDSYNWTTQRKLATRLFLDHLGECKAEAKGYCARLRISAREDVPKAVPTLEDDAANDDRWDAGGAES